MAKKPAPPPAKSLSSSSSSEDEGEDSSSEEEQTNNTKPDPPPAKSLPSSSSSSEEEEDSSSDEEQTNVTKPDPQSTIAKKYKSEESRDEEEEIPGPVSKTLSEPESEKFATQSKPIPEKPNRKSPFTRLWSFDDEIRILRALADYQSKHDLLKFSATGLEDFHQSVKESLSVDVGTTKLSDKIRRLQRKYAHANKKGENVKFLNSQDKSVYELSKKVWPKEEESDDDDGFEVDALNGDSRGMTVNRRKRKTEFPFIMEALAGNTLALQKLRKADAEKVAELEIKFKKNKHEELYLISEAYEMVCNEAEKVMN